MPSCSVQLQQLQVKTRWSTPKSHAGIMHQYTYLLKGCLLKVVGCHPPIFVVPDVSEAGTRNQDWLKGHCRQDRLSCHQHLAGGWWQTRKSSCACLYALATSYKLSFSNFLLQNLSFACHSASWPVSGFPTQSLPEISNKIREIGEDLGWQSNTAVHIESERLV